MGTGLPVGLGCLSTLKILQPKKQKVSQKPESYFIHNQNHTHLIFKTPREQNSAIHTFKTVFLLNEICISLIDYSCAP